ncbi:uncharacterized protein LOC135440767, partial [Drosophila montana]|uniref:uncharacterized protein LOC135440767 n=1 Tax=Drosophila montana TaxID=40370 RepID=UPI00313B8B21
HDCLVVSSTLVWHEAHLSLFRSVDHGTRLYNATPRRAMLYPHLGVKPQQPRYSPKGRTKNVDAHIAEILGLRKVDKSATTQLREFSDKLNSLRALKSMGSVEQIAGCVIVHTLLQKLDSATQASWEDDAPLDVIPSCERFTTFIERRCQRLENADHATTMYTPSSHVGQNNSASQARCCPAAVINVKNRAGSLVPCRALLDSGSQLHIITSRLAHQLQLRKFKSTAIVSGIGDAAFASDGFSVNIIVKSRVSEYSTCIPALIAPSITDNQPGFTLDPASWNIPSNIQLADPEFLKSQQIDMLIGASLFFDLLCVGQIKLAAGLPILQKTRLGWVATGGASHAGKSSFMAMMVKPDLLVDSHLHPNAQIDELIRRFWELECCTEPESLPNKEERDCEALFQANFKRLSTGDYSAVLRFLNLERKLDRNPALKTQYAAFIKEYLDLGHMSLVTSAALGQCKYYLPHHCVLKEDSTTIKLRVVFDGSAVTTSGHSLNDALMADTVTYGTKPASFLSVRAMHQLAMDEQKTFPIGSDIVKRDFSVDDLISGGSCVQDAIEILKQTSGLLAKGNFRLRKWCSSDTAVLQNIPEEDRETLLKFDDGSDITKTLGLDLWREKLDWDESLPVHLSTAWVNFCADYEYTQQFQYPRRALSPDSTVEIHGFCDASLSAYGACVYTVSKCHGNTSVRLLCSKSRVAPVKTITVPKLELCGAALLAQLLSEICQMKVFDCRYYCWSDSAVTLAWVRNDASKFNVFVANRVAAIQELTTGMEWHHIPTELNPADIISRGALPSELFRSPLWANGPSFLSKGKEEWPASCVPGQSLPELRHKVLLGTAAQPDLSIGCKFINSFSKLQRVFAYVYKFVN